MKRVVVFAAVLALAGCGSATNADLTGVPALKPDRVEAYTNIDGHPNLVRLCIGKVAFVTTSREAGNNFLRVPEWDVPFCGAIPTPVVPAPTPTASPR